MERERDQAVTAKMAEDVPKPWLWTSCDGTLAHTTHRKIVGLLFLLYEEGVKKL